MLTYVVAPNSVTRVYRVLGPQVMVRGVAALVELSGRGGGRRRESCGERQVLTVEKVSDMGGVLKRQRRVRRASIAAFAKLMLQ